MPNSVTLAQAKAFLRASGEDELVALLVDAAEARVGQAAGVVLSAASPAPLRLAVLALACHAYEHRHDGKPPPLSLVEPWIAPYRQARL
ncbi:head-tail connector protein [Caulobacter sp. 602-2]|uniref:head-tail connector protein n=1 Tax=Caulobacter sp. 602-2 TaxID=2710887 RepID=UPI00196AD440|nr:head-tail connector protein [Caulobacter sp. 602-2]